LGDDGGVTDQHPLVIVQAPNGATGHDQALQLSDRQALALDALIGGATHAEAAKAAGTHRTTVSRWASNDVEFRAELARRRGEQAEVVAERAADLTFEALSVVQEAVKAKNLAAALGWLRLVAPALADQRASADQRAAEVTVRYVADWRQLGRGDEVDDDEGDS
jgi:hypothetical protein